VPCGVEPAALVPGEGALATGLGATGAFRLEEAGTTIVVIVPVTFFSTLPIVCRAARVASRFAAAVAF
jgi:hypothetical protein